MENDGNFKFGTCIYRSDNPETKTIGTCRCPNGSKEITGYHCSLFDVFPLEVGFCAVCNKFEQKKQDG